nr:type II toxin-antitoxin system RelE/ParE family toxin [Treponema sp. Marseille-Q4523]
MCRNRNSVKSILAVFFLLDLVYQIWYIPYVEIQKKLQADFFKTENGNEPVRNFLKVLSSEDKKSVGADIMAIEMSWPVGYPKVRKMDTDLWELRTSISDKRICRIFFTVSGKKMVLLHAIIKKSQKTPLENLELAKTRKKLVLGGKK